VPGALVLSLGNVFRRKARLVLTMGTLTLAGAIFMAVLSVRSSLFLSFDEALVYYGYDLSVDMGESYPTSRLEREAISVEGVVEAEGWLQKGSTRVRESGTESSDYAIIGVPPETPFLEPVVVEGRWLQAGDRNDIVVNTDFLRDEPDVTIGDTIALKIDNEEQDWDVVGLVTQQYSEPLIYAGYEDLSRSVGESNLANRVVIRLADDDRDFEAEVAQALENEYKDADLLVGATTTRSEFVETFEMRFNFLTIFLMFMAFLLALVGGLSLAGTMGLNVLERVREIGVMQAIGASAGTVQRIIMSEGVAIGILSWALAAAIGLPLSKLLSAGVGIAFGGEPLSFEFSMAGMVGWLGLAVLIASVSSYLPARRASRMSVREALDYE
jgi:putative ABC transport system permease protein